MKWNNLSKTYKNVIIAVDILGWTQYRGYFNVTDINGKVIGKTDMVNANGEPAFIPDFTENISIYENKLKQMGWDVIE